jgi:hypothetical protein
VRRRPGCCRLGFLGGIRLCVVLLCSMMGIASASEKPCEAFDALVETTYGFRPSLLDASARARKSTQMDAVWQMVQKNPGPLVPCLKAALNRTSADPWFLFDGSQLLVSVDPSRESKQVLLSAMAKVSLDDVDLRTWVQTAASLGVDDFDTSELGCRWLVYPNAKYYLPEHGAYEVDRENGAMFIFGALAEYYATPTLAGLCRSSSGKSKEIATWLLMSQATPEALEALKELNPGGLSDQTIAVERRFWNARRSLFPDLHPRQRERSSSSRSIHSSPVTDVHSRPSLRVCLTGSGTLLPCASPRIRGSSAR